jgi:Anti-sigma factor NepR
MHMKGQNDLAGTDAAADEKLKTGRQITPALDQKVQDAIGRSLKAHYDDLVHAPVPDRLLALLAELEAKEGERDS